jgi:AraC family transcriptional regulator
VRSYGASDRLGWTSVYAAAQREAPYQDRFRGVPDPMVILHLDGPVGVCRNLGKFEKRCVIAPGGLFILPGEMDFGVRLENHLDSLHLYVRQRIIDEVAEDFGLSKRGSTELIPRMGEHDAMIEQIARNVRDALHEQTHTSVMYVDYLGRMLAAQLLRKHSASAVMCAAAPGALSQEQMDLTTEYMQVHLAEPISLAQIAAVSGLSPSHFARRFKAANGMPPHRYLMQLRVERAKRLLQYNNAIAEVALRCGFAHQEHLTRVFRRVTGLTPALYRRTLRS